MTGVSPCQKNVTFFHNFLLFLFPSRCAGDALFVSSFQSNNSFSPRFSDVIEEGLSENDRIVISGMSRAREGSVVQPLEEFDVSPTAQEVVKP